MSISDGEGCVEIGRMGMRISVKEKSSVKEGQL